jgi:hypothetical protein
MRRLAVKPVANARIAGLEAMERIDFQWTFDRQTDRHRAALLRFAADARCAKAPTFYRKRAATPMGGFGLPWRTARWTKLGSCVGDRGEQFEGF